jgi:hypothetical protein
VCLNAYSSWLVKLTEQQPSEAFKRISESYTRIKINKEKHILWTLPPRLVYGDEMKAWGKERAPINRHQNKSGREYKNLQLRHLKTYSSPFI